MCSFKITYDKMEEFSILTIDSKYAKNAPILQFLFRASASNIGGPSYFFCQMVENLGSNNKRSTNDVKERIKLEDKINRSVLIYQTNKALN